MTTATATAPVKGMVWEHVKRKTWNGEPLRLTVTQVRGETVYSVDPLWRDKRIKTPLAQFEKWCAQVISVPEPTEKKTTPSLSASECRALDKKAHEAGMAAGEACKPMPMFVAQRANPLDDTSPIVKAYAPVMDGVCGMAYVTVRPGNSSFARWLKKYRKAWAGFHGGTQMGVHHFGQSMERSVAYARAYSEVLRAAGLNAFPESRMD